MRRDVEPDLELDPDPDPDRDMDPFQRMLAQADINGLEACIQRQTAPCYESRLLKAAFPDIRIVHTDSLELYQRHFALFHLLYRLQERFEREGKLLHIHFMRTFLIPYPPAGRCRQYLPESGRFCEVDCVGGAALCDFHNRLSEQGAVGRLSDRYFYLDPANFTALDKKTIDAFINGTWEILRNYADYRASFKVMGLPESADSDMIRKKFRRLAKRYHPDSPDALESGGAARDRFNEVNRAYRLLMRLSPVALMDASKADEGQGAENREGRVTHDGR